jgi:hypothetical protein
MEHRRVEACALADAEQFAPDRRRQQHHARLVALAEDAHLAAVRPWLQVAPLQPGDLRDAQAAGVQQPQQRVVTPIVLKGQDAHDVGFGEDALARVSFLGGSFTAAPTFSGK